MNLTAALALLILGGCSNTESTTSMPPCNAWIFLWGAADLTLNCPTPRALPLLERQMTKQPKKGT